jgi:hypothetical protein
MSGIVIRGAKAPITSANLSRNRIVGQAGWAIDLGDNNRDTNDAMDPDGGDNNTQNYPVLSGLPSGGGWKLNSAPSETFMLEFFQSGQCKNPEADVFLGAYPVKTDAAGDAVFTGPLGMFPGGFITATASDSVGNTSELSDCVAAPQLKSEIQVTSWQTPLRAATYDSRFEVRVDGGGFFNPTGTVDLWVIRFRRRLLRSTTLSGNTATEQLHFLRQARRATGASGLRGDATFQPSTSSLIDVVV